MLGVSELEVVQQPEELQEDLGRLPLVGRVLDATDQAGDRAVRCARAMRQAIAKAFAVACTSAAVSADYRSFA